MSGRIPPSADEREEHEAPEWLKAKGTVKASPLPVATIPLLDVTIPAATLAATLHTVADPSGVVETANITPAPMQDKNELRVGPSSPTSGSLFFSDVRDEIGLPSVETGRIDSPPITPPSPAMVSDGGLWSNFDAVNTPNRHQANQQASDFVAVHSPALVAVPAARIAVPDRRETPQPDRVSPTPEVSRPDSSPVDTAPPLDEFDVTEPVDVYLATNSIAENAVAGTKVGIIAFASDGDATRNGVTYTLANDAGGRFVIDAVTGEVSIATGATFDRESESSITIGVTATSQDGSSSTQSFAIAVTDVDEFDITAISDTNAAANAVNENVAIGTTVGITAFASDGDATTNGITYSLTDNAGGRFAINATTGVVTVAGAIDREAGATQAITVLATSADGSTATQSYTITINDLDEFDVTAISDTDAAANSIAENAAAGTKVGITAFASDGDATTNGVTYSLANDAGGRFVIDAVTGEVSIATGASFDRESESSITIGVTATSQDGSSSTQSFAIAVTDVDEFDVTAISDTNAAANAVNENVAIGTTVGITAFASDGDATTNGITYSLTDNAGGRFAINATTGVVTVAGAIDREAGATQAITVLATSADGSTATQSYTITINDLDEFDVTAISDTDAAANSIAENAAAGTKVGITAFASDGDATTNGVTYSLANDAGGRFVIDAVTGEVSIATGASFDRESESSITIGVTATSQDGSSSTQSFAIAVTDVDEFDITPVGDTDAAANSIAENAAAGTKVGITAFASDGDATTNGVTYSLANDAGGRFVIDAVTGEVSIATGATFDRESESSITIGVTATSQDGSSSTQSFAIAVTDVDEFNITPVGDTDAAANSIAENAAAGTKVGITAFASDGDATTNGITYSLTDNAGGRFAINATTGVVTVAGAIDREAGATQAITVLATSADGSTATRSYTITVNDLDEFDVTAISDTNAAANAVNENAAIGTTVGITAFASDGDATTNGITYSLTDNAGGRFAINATTGVVTVAGAIDREAGATQAITVLATSADGSTATQSYTITINDVDEFDVSPISDTNAAANAVNENVAIGTTVGITAFASDGDATNNGITYSLTDNAGGRFAINATTGVVTVAGALNFETSTSHSITVRATSADGSTATQSYTITINDLDEFDVTAISDTNAAANAVNENVAIGTTVGITAFASDGDATTNGITYSLTDNAGGRFAINATTGVVTVAGALNFETSTSHSITVLATSADGSTATQSYTITINDVDEFNITPVGDTDAAANSIAENAAAGTKVGITAFASDGDATTNGVTYSLANDAGGRFVIDAVTGEVSIATGATFDRESESSITIGVTATSQDGSTTSRSFTIQIADVDEFDVSPINDTNAAANAVNENVAIGTTVGITAFASDGDATTNGITYSLTDNAGGRFAINTTTGVVTVAGALNFETSTSHSITVLATSADGSTATQSYTITINDLDEFGVTAISDTNAAANSIAENAAAGTKVGITAFASDGDAATNGISYSLANDAGGRFVIDAVTGEVSIATGATFDRESESSITIGVTATSQDGSTTSRSFTIQIADVDEFDVSPINDTNAAANAVNENVAIGTTVGITAFASDGDATNNGITYSLTDNAGGRFAINATTGVVTVAGAIDREAGATQAITVLATSADGSTATQSYTITINDVDEFDVSPISDTNAAANAVNENVAIGTTVGITAFASDGDATTNGITYSLTDNAGGRFAINATTGVVTVAGAIDREAGATQAITVLATSADGSTATQSYTITINDVDEFDVTAISDTDAAANSIAENAAAGTKVGITAFASDGDATTNGVTYSLANDAGGRFVIDAVTGEVSIATGASFDRESESSITIGVTATSQDGSSSTQSFAIAVTDVDEFNITPVSDTDAAANSIAENAAAGTKVGITAFASDGDAATNGISYSLANDAGGRFVIDAVTGEVSIATGATFDRESESSITIGVTATSQDGSSSTQSFAIAVTDVDEFNITPVGDTDAAANSIAENAAAGTKVGITAFASDGDATTNGVTYSLANDAGGRFVIDAVTGEVSIATGATFDRESESSITIGVTATSQDGSSSTQSFAIAVTDVDEFDVSPVGDTDAAANSIAENAAAGTKVGITAFASDGDATTNGVTYSLANDAGGRFVIDAVTGEVSIATGATFDRESESSITIGVTATSQDGSSSTQSFAIAVTDVDEFNITPVGDTDAAANSIAENAAAGTKVGITAFASDGDATTNGVTYSLANDAGGRFVIDAVTGEVSIATGATFDRESESSITIGVTATSQDGSSSTQSFAIAVTDVDEFNITPVSDTDAAANSIAENAAAGTKVGITAFASDGDAATNGISYSLANDAGGRFVIDAVTGEVSIATGATFDRESESSITIGVTATSQDGSSSTQSFAIAVTDVDEFNITPVGDTDAAANSIAENAAAGTKVGITAFASDGDAATNGISYSLANDAGGRFVIDAVTGEVSIATGATFDRESESSITIGVTATSQDGSSSTQSFAIAVTDVDEFDVTAISDTNAAANAVNENVAIGTTVGITAFASDGDATTNGITYSLTDNAGGRFAINATTGVVTVAGAIDREAGATQAITVLATSADGSTATQSYTITINDVDEFDVTAISDTDAAANSIAENAAAGTKVGITAFASDGDATTNGVMYSLANDAGGRFVIDAVTGEVSIATGATFDRESESSITIGVTATSQDGSSSTQSFAIAVTDVDEFNITPVGDTDAAANSIAENAAAGTKVGITAFASDGDATTNGVTYSLANDAGGRFVIDAVTGEVSIATGATFDRESESSITIGVTATSQDGSSSTQSFAIAVTDVDEFDVTAISDTNAAANAVNENVAIGTTVGITAFASDGDATNNGITYSLTDNAGGRFVIDAVTGEVSIATGATFDRESESSITIGVTATSQDGSSSTQSFAIAVTDVDEFDVTPVSDSDAAANSIAENATAGTKVGITAFASDGDAGTNGITYSLANDAGGRFVIDAATGEVSIATGASFDRETESSITIGVTATSQDGSSSTQSFAIAVTDVDEFDVTPVSDSDAAANSIAENATAGTKVGITAFASDGDAATNGITYSLANDAGGRFVIDAVTGEVSIATGASFDRESEGSITIGVTATSQDGSSSTQSFAIAVTDVDEFDVTPVSDSDAAANSIAENAAAGTKVGITAFASDGDATTNGVTYSLANDAGGRFVINANTGEVSIATGASFDRETEGSITIGVTATSQDGSSSTQSFAIAVTDVDEFDVSPVSDTDAAANSIAENATAGTKVGITAFASDGDAGTNGITYSLANDAGGRFVIDAVTGEVSIATGASFDRETEGSITIGVTATSQDGSSSTQSFAIAVTDVDEFNITPVSDTDAAANSIAENAAAGTKVGITAFASDGDAATNGISYSLANDAGGRFVIDAVTGEVSIATGATFDRESESSITIGVTATSQDGSSSTQSFAIAVTDVDEFNITPVSDTDAAANSIAENAAAGTKVGITAFASDGDATTNGVTYSLANDAGGRFVIDAVTGEVSIATGATFDRESESSITIGVTATSQDGSSSTQSFAIAVTDVDEFNITPVGDTDAAANSIAENAAAGTKVGITAFASDGDATTNGVTYSLANDAGGRFVIDAVTGEVSIATGATFDRESESSITIGVTATSQDGSSSTQSFAIAVTDVDEFNITPVGDTDAAANSIAENAAAGTKVGITAFASDGDATTNGVTYSLANDAGGRFVIDAVTGEVSIATGATFDRESESSITIGVTATSQDGSSSTQSFAIAVTDVDEFNITPVGDTDAAANSIAENAAAGTKVGITAFASDGDATTNGVTYSLANDAGGRFVIDAVTGEVSIATGATFDRESESSITIGVTATSQDGSSSTQSFAIAVTDVDEFNITPVGDTDAAANSIAENAAAGTKVGITAFASDGDATTNGVTYSLANDAGGRFVIDAVTGEVSIATGATFDRESESSITIGVTATSQDGSSSTQSFAIAVTDVDEFDVTAISDTNAAANAVNENVAIGTTVGITAFASDGDATTNGITYSLTDNAGGRFAINATTGVVTVAGAIDREAGATQAITVLATSADGSTATQSYTITINDLDEFDVTAISDTDAAANSIAENAAAGTKVGITAFASDGDATTNGVTYSLANDAGGRFVIDAVTGEVSIATGASFDRESEGSITIGVTATSQDGSSSTQSFAIAVTDVDEFDVTPVSDSDAAANSIAENAAAGTKVGITAFASDGDATTNGVTYSLANDAGGRFVIDAATGEVSIATGASFDRETESSITIGVTATSQDGSSSTQSFAIAVTDVDEFDVSPVSDTDAAANSIAENATAGTKVGITAFASDGDAGTNGITYSLANDAGGRFVIDAVTGEVSIATGASFDRESEGSITIGVTATSQDGSSSTQSFAIAVTDVDEFDVSPVSDTDAAANSIAENAAAGTKVGITAFASDGDAATNGISYSLANDAGGRFVIDAVTGEVSIATGASFDRETESSITIGVTATSQDGSSSTQSFAIAVTDVDEFDVSPVSDTDAAANSIAENATAGTKVGITAFASDGDAATNGISYSLANDAGGRFVIDAVTGEVSIATGATFDRESESSITIGVTATSQDGSSSTQSFAIAVTDVDEFDVTAISDTNAAANAVNENVAIGTTVGITAFASDGDATTNGITYSLTDNAGGRFAINATTGVVTVAGAIDREAGATQAITVLATSADGSTATQSYTITINDVDEFDVTPVSDTDAAANSIAENAAAGTKVGITAFASDGDATTNGVTYSLANDAGGRFVIDAATGEVSIATGASFDRETESSITIGVTATSQDGSSSTQSFAIAVTDVDEFDVSPVSDTDAAANSIAENATAGTKVGITAFASDGDAGTNGITYSLANDAGGRFVIDAVTGEVSIATGASFDRESEGSITIGVTATSQDGSSSTQSFAIAVTDVDEFDVTPVSDSDAAANSIAENATAGTKVGITAFASDGDAGTNGITYSLANDAGGRFVIDAATGEVSIATGASFDRETESSITIGVTATSQDGSSSTQSFAIAVTDVDEFDVTPVSDSDAAANSIAENATAGTKVGITAFASDGDAATNGITYSLANDAGGRFVIDAVTGEVSIATGASFDRESEGSITIGVTATSQDGSSSTQSFAIAVTDVDEFDVTPVSDSDAAANSIAENAAAGTKVGITAFASDGDATTNGVTYSLANDAGGRFVINANTGEVSIATGASFDRESEGSITIGVTATSQDGSSSTQSFAIAVTDVDEFDVSPVSDTDAAANSIAENATAGTKVGITAFASDGDAGTNGITYSLANDAGGRFVIDAATGEVSIATGASFDRETEGSITIGVTATSQDGSSSTQSFAIAVTDVDEFDVTAISDTNAAANAVNENVAIGTTVGIAAFASDGDATNNGITYSLTDNAGGRFAINATTGVVTVAGAIDREAGATQAITVLATSADGSTATQSYTITINDLDEFDVTAISDTNAAANAVNENVAIGTTVGITAFASDGDATTNGITYSLTDNAGGRFTINATTGVVTVAGAIDREAGATQAITVLATSADGSTATQSYTITINDVDEFDVTAISDTNAAANAVNENAAIGTTVGITAFASDGDATTNGITYSLTDNAGGRFAINATTGVVTVAGAIDREAGPTQAITVLATSADGSTATQSYTITINDVDEFDVTAISDTNAAANAVNENAAIGTTVGITAFASDGDATTNGITYSLTDNAGGRFAINATTGVVTVAGAIDREAGATQAITVLATSADGSTATQSYTITINDLDEFDVTAISDTNAAANAVNENVAIGTTVGITAFASDGDATTNGITYSLTDNAGGRFAINATTGVVTVAGAIDREAGATQAITVLATSADGSTATQSYTITINDVDEFDVTAISDTNAAANAVNENAAIGTTVGITAFASDGDATTNGITYSLTDNAGGRFAINATTGVVTVAGAIDREAGPTQAITVLATSADGSTATQSYTITINDVDEFDVTAISDTNAAANAVNENAAIGTTVGITAFASDGDATTNGITYSLTDNAGGRFAINATTGVVTVAGAIDREAGPTQAITVLATSADGSTATQSYTITINDVDEFDVTAISDTNAAANAVNENVAIGTTVGITAFASDGDATTNGITYSLTDNAGGRFAINATTGVVTVAGAIDREAGATQAITVLATSADGSTATQSYTITINDVDEFDVTAISDTNAAANAVNENAAIGTTVGITAFASDGDATNNGITYSLTDNAGGRFAINATTGVVTVAGAIDREAGATQAITVLATSADGSTATQSYTITINDVDEFDVTAISDTNAAANAVNENVAIGTTVGITAFASDGDATTNGITYSLTDNAGGRFAINATTGVVTVAGAIDREAGPTQAITVLATSADGSTATQSYTITINDVDEFDVTAISDTNAAANAVNENAAIGTTVGITAFASDGDATTNGITYSLTDNAGGRFAINATTGVVTVAGAIDREAGPTQAITVLATSADGSTATQSYTITINDVDEFDVTAISDTNAAANAVNENAAIGTTVGITAFASDGDATNNGITYSLTDNAGGRFAINATTGVVTVAGAIDREAGATQAITVLATSADGSTATQSYTITINDLDEFDVTAISDTNAAANAVNENVAIGTTVGITAFASDGDATNNGITYSLTDNAGGRFAINATTGVVTVAGALNFEASTSHTITVRATSADGSFATQNYTIGVNDLNDETPTNISLAGTTINEEGTGKITFTLAGEKDLTPPRVEVFANGVSLGIVELTNARDTRVNGTFGGLADLEAVAQTFTLNLPLGVLNPGTISFLLLNDSYNPSTGSDTNFYVKNVSVGDTSVIGSQGSGAGGIVGQWAMVHSSGMPISFTPPSGGWDTRQIVGTLSTTDADANNSFTYTLTSDPSGLFAIAGDKIIVKAGMETNFEAAASHTVTVQVNDGAGNIFSKALTISVNNISEAPTDVQFVGSSLVASTNGDIVVGPQAVNHPDLVVGFALNEGTGTTATSLNGGASLTLINGAGWTTAPVGSAIDLAGATTNAGPQARLTPFAHSGAISVSMYARMDNVDAGAREWQRLFDFGDTNNTIWAGTQFTTDDMQFEVIINGIKYFVLAPDAVQDGEWAHWSFTINETGLMRIYKNGDLLAQNQGATPSLNGTGIYRLGASSFSGDDALDGAIADVTIHRDDLSQAEVAQLAANSRIGLTASTWIADVSGVTSPVTGDTFTYSLINNASGVFTINATTGEISLSDPYVVPGGPPELVSRTGTLNPFNGFDQGNFSKPHFVDIDKDGDMDLFVGRDTAGLAYYRNTGTATNPVYTFVQHNPFTLNSNTTLGDVAFVDINNDGDLDAFVSDSTGNTQYFQNIGTATNPNFTTPITNPFGLADVGSNGSIAFADLDGDGDQDAMIGNLLGNFRYFRNTGTASSPSFTYVGQDPFGLAEVGDAAVPEFADLDGDGDLDLLAGREDGQFSYFQNIGSTTTPNFVLSSMNPFGLADIGSNSNVSMADIDGDRDLDLVVGISDGTLLYYENIGTQNRIPLSDTVTVRVTGSSGESYEETIGVQLGTKASDTINGTGTTDVIYGLGQTGDVLSGNGGDDIIYGSSGNDTINGGDGNDLIEGGLGNDNQNGGAGIDTLSYAGSNAAVSANLATGAVSGGHATGDTISSFENLTGSVFNDTLVGDDNANRFNGGKGNDTLTGAGGSDWFSFVAGDGTDSVNGGTGGGWIDVIEMRGIPSSSFTLTLNAGSTISSQNASEILLSSDASGSIVYGSGDRVNFSGIERITW